MAAADWPSHVVPSAFAICNPQGQGAALIGFEICDLVLAVGTSNESNKSVLVTVKTSMDRASNLHISRGRFLKKQGSNSRYASV